MLNGCVKIKYKIYVSSEKRTRKKIFWFLFYNSEKNLSLIIFFRIYQRMALFLGKQAQVQVLRLPM